jgi:DNA (cytosine-5)-methyltransferase 1
MKYTYLEVCAGCGGLSLGLETAGLIPKCLIEIDKNCVSTLQTNFKTKICNDDMRKVDFTEYKNNIDIVVGGIPCQSFSIAGKREGLSNKDKGGLFYDFLRCLKEIEPKMFMIENVEGLKNINGGKTLEKMIEDLSDLGYDVKYTVLNSVNFNVPQKRKRLIIIGTPGGVDFVWPIEKKKILTIKDALKNVPESPGTLYSDAKKKILKLVPEGGCWINLPIDIQKKYMGKSFESGGGKRGIARRLSWNEPCLTLTTSPCQKQTERCHPEETRPFKTREYARIQTFPDDFKFAGSISSIYKQIGNAVPPMLAFYVGRKIMMCLNEIYVNNIKSHLLFDVFDKFENDKHKMNISMMKNKLMTTLSELFKYYYEAHIMKIYETTTEATDIDHIKKEMDKGYNNISDKEWQQMANFCLQESKITQQIGKLHEYIMANLKGYMFCKDCKGEKIPADIMKKDKTIFIELKNKHNTMNSGSRKSVIKNLIEIKKRFPDATVVLGIINPKNGDGCCKKIPNDEKIEIYEYSGKKLSELVYGNENLFEDLETEIHKYFKMKKNKINPSKIERSNSESKENSKGDTGKNSNKKTTKKIESDNSDSESEQEEIPKKINKKAIKKVGERVTKKMDQHDSESESSSESEPEVIPKKCGRQTK